MCELVQSLNVTVLAIDKLCYPGGIIHCLVLQSGQTVVKDIVADIQLVVLKTHLFQFFIEHFELPFALFTLCRSIGKSFLQ